MALKVIHRLQAFSNAIRRTLVQHFTRFQLRVCSRGPSALAKLLVDMRRSMLSAYREIALLEIPQSGFIGRV